MCEVMEAWYGEVEFMCSSGFARDIDGLRLLVVMLPLSDTGMIRPMPVFRSIIMKAPHG